MRATTQTLKTPALEWVDGHILGNGDVGAVVWGTADSLCIGLNKHDVWDLAHPLPHGNRWSTPYPELVRRVLAGEREILAMNRTPRYADATQCYQLSCGTLQLELLRGQPVKAFEQTLDLALAEVRVVATPTRSGFMWGVDYQPITVTVRVDALTNVVVARLASDRAQRVAWCLRQPLPLVRVDGGDAREGVLAFGGELGPVEITVQVGAVAGAAADVKAHRAWWRSFWSRSSVELDDGELEWLWRFGLYALACSTRPHTSPPHLQGIWNHYAPGIWHTDFHLNLNLQMCHWAACTSNHAELQSALIRCLTRDWREGFRLLAREEFGAPGVAVPLCIDLKGRSLGGWLFDVELCMTAWLAQHVNWHWQHTGEMTEEMFSFLRECGEFYASILVRDARGQFNIELSHAPEQNLGGRFVCGRNPAVDVALIRELYLNFAEACRQRRVADPFAGIAQHLPPLPVEAGTLIDHEVNYLPEGDAPGRFPYSHRTPARLVPVWPCEEIGLHRDLALGRRSFEEFRSYGDADFSGWSYTFQACIAARLGLAAEARGALQELIEHFTYAGGLTSHNRMDSEFGPVFQIEALMAAPAAVNEMLLQSVGGVLRLFPALPRGQGASFTDLHAPGGFLVSAEYDGRRVVRATVRSERGGTVRLLWNNEIVEWDGGVERERVFDLGEE
ncbi:MAG: glycoside hydrolase family 95 protein [Lentisphaerae bacterium]|nr:glycoside hydrolase family 95 protein [Lentisphaerota bacterium]